MPPAKESAGLKSMRFEPRIRGEDASCNWRVRHRQPTTGTISWADWNLASTTYGRTPQTPPNFVSFLKALRDGTCCQIERTENPKDIQLTTFRELWIWPPPDP